MKTTVLELDQQIKVRSTDEKLDQQIKGKVELAVQKLD